MKTAILILLIVCGNSYAQNLVIYYDTNTNDVLTGRAAGWLDSTGSSSIATASAAASSYDPTTRQRWNGSTLAPISAVRAKALDVESMRREVWRLQAIRSQAVSNATTAELRSIDRDIDYNQRAIVYVLNH